MKTSCLIIIALLASLAPRAQETTAQGGRFSKDGLSFDYPAGWALADTSDAESQRVVLARAGGGSNLIMVFAQRPLHLVNVRAGKDEAAGAAAWKTLLDTLNVEAPAQPSPEVAEIEQVIPVGDLNHRAVKKPAPEYPPIARGARASGTVTVQVIVDEQGKVVRAVAVSGHTLLQAPSVEAVKKAKFEPMTLCGRPVRVSGLVTYNYVIQ